MISGGRGFSYEDRLMLNRYLSDHDRSVDKRPGNIGTDDPIECLASQVLEIRGRIAMRMTLLPEDYLVPC